ncbi:hypothetical protein O3M35_000933 [Rhynocoris fuscipes]|uniref:Serine/threonine-protein phosphatase 4 regulatory subunit 2 n=1 Tax=Rhynocoris fuscipes TaxID=488301 RepID=A0AAW1DRP6_9HEMI
MDNAEEVMHSLEEFSKLKPKDIPRELDDYLGYVAKTGDPVFKWSIIKCLFREKLLSVITDFYESTLTIELPPCPNVDTFNYERMKANLLERLDSFHGAPFTVQRISELLTNPRKEYNRADKFMRAIEKNILVVSIREPGRYSEIDGDNQSDPSFNGIPESNDSSLETSFTCNDLADPDSSSQVYEVVNAETRDPTYTVNVDANVVSEVQISVENENLKEEGSCSGTSSDDSQEENIVEISSAPEKCDSNNISEKENESVICSTVTSHSHENEKQNEVTNNDENTDPGVSSDSVSKQTIIDNIDSSSVENATTSSAEVEKDTCTASSSEENIENSVFNTSTEISLESEIPMNTTTPDVNITEECQTDEKNLNEEQLSCKNEEQKEAAPIVCESVPVPMQTEDTSLVFVDDRTVECDTSNTVDSDNSCDQENKEQLEVNQENDSTEVKTVIEENEVSSCEENLNEQKSEETSSDDNTRETSVIHTTPDTHSTPEYIPESMEVVENQEPVTEESSQH